MPEDTVGDSSVVNGSGKAEKPDEVDQIEQLAQQIRLACQPEQFRFRRELDRIRRQASQGKPFDRNLTRLTQRVATSIETLEARRKSVPKLEFPEELPVVEHLETIQNTIRDHQVVIVCGETGSGKSTQLPKICLSIGRGLHGQIGHTQPRRIAARTIASRVAEELHSKVGEAVGFKIRFTDTSRSDSLIKLMTDGILLAETQADQFLNQYDTLIIDEAHERSLNIDFLLGYLKRLLLRRRDLKLIITSATIDAERFAEHFGDGEKPAPIVEVSGRTYPVEVRYRPPQEADSDEEVDWHRAVVDAIDELATIDNGHILVFMPTERDIHELMKLLRGHVFVGDGAGHQTEVLPLYARLTAAEQSRVFRPRVHRRIVISTNVAESSLTVPGVRYVVDTGTARISRYSPRSKLQRLPIEPISRASADQRMGRCGRTGPGIGIRLFSEEDYESREQFMMPEIQRTNLAAVILQTLALNLGSLDTFPFIDPPKPTAVKAGYRTLFELGAIDEQNQLTETGKRLHRLPVDPRIGRMILAGHDEACLHEVLIIASVLEIRDPRDRPLEKQEAADQAHQIFADEDSDFLTYLRIWDWFHEQKSDLSRSQLRRRCEKTYVSWNRMREWTDIFRQLRQLVEGSGMKLNQRKNDAGSIHRALLTGLLSSLAYLPEGHEYSVAEGTRAFLWPGSVLARKKPKWVMGAELVETNRRYLRTIARIQPQWIEPLAPHLTKRAHTDPFWDAERGAAMTNERVSLFGLTIVPRRVIPLHRVDRTVSREMFIHHALVENDWEDKTPVVVENLQLRKDVEQLQAKTRRFDLVKEQQAIYEFYDERIPARVFDARSFRRWLRDDPQKRSERLKLTREILLHEDAAPVLDSDFPDSILISKTAFPLEYHLEPGSDDDGITIKVPSVALNQFAVERLGWLVPGLLEEKVTAMIKSLPKALRRNFIPAPDTAREVVAELKFGQGDFDQAVATSLSRIAGEPISPDIFDAEKLPRHLRMNVSVVDDEGGKVVAGRDADELQKELAPSSAAELNLAATEWNRDGIEDWDLNSFPAKVATQVAGMDVQAFPMLVDQGGSVSLRLAATAAKARRETTAALRRLFLLANHRKLKSQVDWLPQLDKIQLYASSHRGLQSVREQLLVLIADRACLPQEKPPRDREAFELWMKQGRNRISVAVQDVAKVALPVMEAYHQTRIALDDQKFRIWSDSRENVQRQLERMLTAQFLETTPWGWLQQFPRYLQAAQVRLKKLNRSNVSRDLEIAADLETRWEEYSERLESQNSRELYDAELEYYRWMLEEYRVSVYAQELRTAIKVSPERLDRQWAKTTA